MLRFHILFVMTVYYKIRQMLLQNVTAILFSKCDRNLLQNATVLLQNVTVITKCDDFMTKRDSYYKMQRLSQIATVHSQRNTI